MVPRKPKELIAEFARLHSYSEDDISVIVTECYDEVRRQVEYMDYDYLSLPGIGTLFIKAWTVKRRIKVLEHSKFLSFKTHEVELERLTTAYDRMSTNFYNEVGKDFMRTVGKGPVTKKTVHDYSQIEGHIFNTWKPGTKCYHHGCRCVQCTELHTIYHREYKQRKKDEPKGNIATGLGE